MRDPKEKAGLVFKLFHVGLGADTGTSTADEKNLEGQTA